MKFLKDLLAGSENKFWDLGRILAAIASLSMVGGAVWNVVLGMPIDLGPAGLGGGFAAVLTASAALIAAKDWAHTNAVSQVTRDTTAAVSQRKQDQVAETVADAVVVQAEAAAEMATAGTAAPQEVVVVNEPDDAVPTTDETTAPAKRRKRS